MLSSGKKEKQGKSGDGAGGGGRTDSCFSMQMGSFIRCAIILIISYSNSSS